MSGATNTTQHVELRDDLVRLVTSRLLDPLEILLPNADVDRLREQVRQDAEMWAAQLLGVDDTLARHVAARMIAVLYPGDEPFDPPESWWVNRGKLRRHPDGGVTVASIRARLDLRREHEGDAGPVRQPGHRGS